MAKCKACKAVYTPSRPLQQACSVPCAIQLANAKRDKSARVAIQNERKATRIAKDRIKNRGEWAREAQQAFNAWIRERDKGLPCISCGRHHTGQLHAGHYRSRGAHPELTYEPLNCNLQCAPCNTFKSGNVVEYRINLLKKIGQEALDWLEGPHDPKKYTIDELRQIRDDYRFRLRSAKKESTE